MSDPFLGEMKLMPWGYAPRGWARCDGTLMAANQNRALCSILGKTFGGDGVNNFQLPDMRGRVPLGAGKTYGAGTSGGEEKHMLTAGEVPSHTHAVQGLNKTVDQPNFLGFYFGNTASPIYGLPPQATNQVTMTSGPVVQSTGGTAHENRQPYQVITMCIALSGIYPSRS